MRVALGLGSNLGDRMAHLQAAVDGLAAGGVHGLSASGVHETDPVGGVEQPDYLNAVVVGDTDLAPRQVLDLCLGLEQRQGRVRTVRNGPRTLDVDVLAYGALVIAEPDLLVPHPRLAERAFVLVPWAQVDPEFEIPGVGTVADRAASVDPSGVRPRKDLALKEPGRG